MEKSERLSLEDLIRKAYDVSCPDLVITICQSSFTRGLIDGKIPDVAFVCIRGLEDANDMKWTSEARSLDVIEALRSALESACSGGVVKE